MNFPPNFGGDWASLLPSHLAGIRISDFHRECLLAPLHIPRRNERAGKHEEPLQAIETALEGVQREAVCRALPRRETIDRRSGRAVSRVDAASH